MIHEIGSGGAILFYYCRTTRHNTLLPSDQRPAAYLQAHLMTYPFEIVLVVLLLVGGFVFISVAGWGLLRWFEARINEKFDAKLTSVADKLRISLKEEITVSRHDLRGEMQHQVGLLDIEMRQSDNREREIKSWIDKHQAWHDALSQQQPTPVPPVPPIVTDHL